VFVLSKYGPSVLPRFVFENPQRLAPFLRGGRTEVTMTDQTRVDWDSFAYKTRRKQDRSGSWKQVSVQKLVLAQDTWSVLGEFARERQRNLADYRRRVAQTASTEGTLLCK